MLNRNLFLSALSALVLTTCSNSLNDLVIVAKLDNEFAIELWEKIDTLGRSAEVILRSAEKLECSNVELNVASNRVGNQLHISIKDLINPDNCESDPGVELSRVNFGSLNPSFYTLKVDLLEIADNELLLDVTPEAYRLSDIQLNGLLIGRRELLRIPEPAVWGFVDMPDSLAIPVGQELLASLSDLTDQIALAPGYYGYFELDSDPQKPLFDQDLPSGKSRVSFLVKERGDLQALDSLFRDFQDRYGEDVRLEAWSGRGYTW